MRRPAIPPISPSSSRRLTRRGSPLYGTEINWQQPFNFLPDFWSNFGYLGNVTFVQAQQTYLNPDGTVQAIADLNNLSRTSLNSTLYYDDSVFQARISGAFRSKYIPNAGVNPGGLNDVTIARPTLNVDFSSSYKVNDEFTITAEALNPDQPALDPICRLGRQARLLQPLYRPRVHGRLALQLLRLSG